MEKIEQLQRLESLLMQFTWSATPHNIGLYRDILFTVHSLRGNPDLATQAINLINDYRSCMFLDQEPDKLDLAPIQ